MAAFSQDQLVNSMGNIITKNAISKYEKGRMKPDGKVLLALAKALNVKPDYFFRPFTVEITNVEFRKKKSLPEKEARAIKQEVTDYIERYLEIEQFLNIGTSFFNPLRNIQIKNVGDIERAALHLRQSWNLGLNALPNVIDLLENREIKVVEVEASESFDGFSGWTRDQIPILVINKNFNSERKRLTALHELGHLILDFPSDLPEKTKERYCFGFAGALLLPEKVFRSEIGSVRTQLAVQELIALKEVYGISIQAIMARAKDLGIINEALFVRFREWINSNRNEKDLGSYCQHEKAFRFRQLIYRAASEEIISLSKAANLSNQKLAEFRKDFIAV